MSFVKLWIHLYLMEIAIKEYSSTNYHLWYLRLTNGDRGERIVFWGPNTNTNIIRLPKNDRIQIRILFGFPKMTKYEYEYYSISQKWPNTNTNILRFPKMTEYEYEYYSATQKWPNRITNVIQFPNNDSIQISFGFPKMTEYEYYLATQKWLNTNTNIIRLPNNDQIQISFGFPKMKEYYIQIQILLSCPKGTPPRPVLSLTRWC